MMGEQKTYITPVMRWEFFFLLFMEYEEEKEMKMFKLIVPFHTEEEKRRLEDYFSERTGRPVDLGPIDYDGKMTIIAADADLTEFHHTNITCAACFPGMRFHDPVRFIKWHQRVTEMGYLVAWKEQEDPNDVIALFYEEKTQKISYVCVRMGDKKRIEAYLGPSEGKAIPIRRDKNHSCWLLLSNTNGNMLMFTKTENTGRPFRDIDSGDEALDFFRHLIDANDGTDIQP